MVRKVDLFAQANAKRVDALFVRLDAMEKIHDSPKYIEGFKAKRGMLYGGLSNNQVKRLRAYVDRSKKSSQKKKPKTKPPRKTTSSKKQKVSGRSFTREQLEDKGITYTLSKTGDHVNLRYVNPATGQVTRSRRKNLHGTDEPFVKARVVANKFYAGLLH